MASPSGIISDERLVEIKLLLFHIVQENIYERCVMSKNSPQELTLFECRFSTSCKILKKKKEKKTDVHNYNAFSIQIQ